ncbi:MAG: endospore germination permease [Clostridium sp.]
MKKQTISRSQMQVLIFTFPIGIYILFGIGSNLKQDAWIGSLAAMIITIPVVYLYGLLLNLYPGKNIFEMIEEIFGTKVGKVITTILVLHCLFVSSSILHNLSDFIELTALWQTPRMIPIALVVILSIYILRKGIEVVFNWIRLNLVIILVVFVGLTLIMLNDMDINNLRPVFNHSIADIFKSSIVISMLGFTEIFVFLGFSDCVENKNLKTLFIKPIFYACIVCTVIMIGNILLVGGEAYSTFYYPGYEAIRRVYALGEYQRLEAIVSISFTIFRYIELSVYLFASAKGIQSLFNLRDYRPILAPVGFIVLNGSYAIYGSMYNAVEFIRVQWTAYGIIMQVIFPLFIFIAALIKRGIGKTVEDKAES